MTPVADALDWTVGQHGIHITFYYPPTSHSTISDYHRPSDSSSSSSHRYTGTYLPEVIPAQKWSKEEAVLSLIRKAGYRGRVTVGDALWRGIEMKVYESRKGKKHWGQYVQWKQSQK